MGQRHIQQTDFSGGEISTRMVARVDTEIYAKALLTMENFHPTQQGTAERTPGTRFQFDTGATEARIMPYITPANERALLIMQEGTAQLYLGINSLNTPQGQATAATAAAVQAAAPVPIREQIMPNFRFEKGPSPWVVNPEFFRGGGGGGPDANMLGVNWTRAGLRMVCRVYKYPGKDTDFAEVRGEGDITFPTNTPSIRFQLNYVDNVNNPESDYKMEVKVGTTPDGDDVLDYSFQGPPGTIRTEDLRGSLPGPGYTGKIYVWVKLTALGGSGPKKYSSPVFLLPYFGIWADNEVDIDETAIIFKDAAGTVIGSHPFLEADLKDIHYVQSPYNRVLQGKPSKELVLVHPNHPPHRLYFDTNEPGYVMEPIDFDHPGTGPPDGPDNNGPSVAPPEWTVGNYPSTCTSCMGRLVLAGGQNLTELGSANGSNAETVWATEVARWDEFSDALEVTPESSLEFATIYRSPIQWVFGQKELMVGAREMEYIAIADGIYAPNDLGVAMHSTHGSKNVQPVGLGQTVVFPAEGGTRVRAMSANSLDEGFVAPDLTLLHPDLCRAQIRRMARLRNPHQIVVVLLEDGNLAFLHQDTYASFMGWSRLNLNVNIKDIAVVANNEGVDNLYMLVERTVGGVAKLYLEVMDNWVESGPQQYLSSASIQDLEVPTDTITGLDHLEGKFVGVMSNIGYLGSYRVNSGSITLTTDVEGVNYTVSSVIVGLATRARLRTLPVVNDPTADGMGAISRLSEVGIRVRGSSRPLVGVVSTNESVPDALRRFEDRSPRTPIANPTTGDIIGRSESLEIVSDFKMENLGSDIYQTVVVEEDLPLRVEVMAIYGKLTSKSA